MTRWHHRACPGPGQANRRVEQVLQLIQGKVYAEVATPGDLERELRDKFEGPDDDVTAILRRFHGLTVPDFARLFGQDLKVRIPGAVCAIRGTRFRVEIAPEGTTEVSVLEGAVEISHLTAGTSVLVEGGFTAVVTKDGISGPRKTA